MDMRFIQQVVVFAAAFLLFQVGFDWLQGRPITLASLGVMAATSVVATAIYAGLILWLKKRKERGD